ncbi:MAG TPA: hypothetical protein PLW81_11560 [Thiobacillaceae bacterium]|nr:hypothetical protein [Thiobacillaceae bacterium]
MPIRRAAGPGAVLGMADMPTYTTHASAQALLQAALHHLLRHGLLGCPQSAERAAWLLDMLTDATWLDEETRGLCDRMSQGLCTHPTSIGGGHHV